MALVLIGVVAAIRLERPAARHRRHRARPRSRRSCVVVTLVLIVPFQVSRREPRRDRPSSSPSPTRRPPQKRDVYWLIFDRYGSDRSLRAAVRHPQRPCRAWLREQGFTVLDKSHANYVRTGRLDPDHDEHGPPRGHRRHARPRQHRPAPVHGADAGSSLVARQFKALGYRYYHIGSWWSPNAHATSAADVNLNVAGPVGLRVRPLRRERRARGRSSGSGSSRHDRRARPPLQAQRLRARRRSPSCATSPAPSSSSAHVLLPHPPTVFDRDGRS